MRRRRVVLLAAILAPLGGAALLIRARAPMGSEEHEAREPDLDSEEPLLAPMNARAKDPSAEPTAPGGVTRPWMPGRSKAGSGQLTSPMEFGSQSRLEVEVASAGELPTLLWLQRWDAAASAWLPDRELGKSNGKTAGGALAWQVDGVAEGRYRLFEVATEKVSDTVDFRIGYPATLRLDLSSAGWVRGTVEAPGGADGAKLQVWMWHGTSVTGPSSFMPAYTNDAGDFELMVPGDRPVTLQAWSPDFLPDGDAGRVTLTTPRDGVRLRLRRGPSTEIQLFEPDGSDMQPNWGVLLSSSPTGTSQGPITTFSVIVRRGVLSVGCLEPGSYRWSMDDRIHGVLTLPEVVVRPEGARLGVHRFPEGCTIRLEVLGGSTLELATLRAYAESLDTSRPLSRWGPKWKGRDEPWRMTGLEPGKQRVQFRINGVRVNAEGGEQIVTASPDFEAVATIDLRSEVQGSESSR